MIKNLLTSLLCFSETDGKRKCRSLTRKNDNLLSDSSNFDFQNEFDVDTFPIPDSTHDHWMASMANYVGFPVILGGKNNVILEILDTKKNVPEWITSEQKPPYRNQ